MAWGRGYLLSVSQDSTKLFFPWTKNIHSLIIWTPLLVPRLLQVFTHYCISGTVRKLIYSYPFWWMDFVAIPVFFSDRYSTLQSGSSTQDHRLMKNEIWITFCKIQKQSCSVILKVVQFGQHSVPVSNVCWSPHWELLLVANLSPMSVDHHTESDFLWPICLQCCNGCDVNLICHKQGKMEICYRCSIFHISFSKQPIEWNIAMLNTVESGY